jgi:transposase-like protein
MQKKCVPYGSDVSSGTYKCADCGYEYSNQSKPSLPPCPKSNQNPNSVFYVEHTKNCWDILSGQGDANNDPYPDN